jgi:hypothetical protein
MIGARSPRGQEDSKVILTDAAITNALNQTVQKIREGDLEQAQTGPAWGKEGGEVLIPKIQT